MPGLRRDWPLRGLQRGGLRLQAALGGDGQQGTQGRQEHGHQIHRRAAQQVDLLQQVLLHPLLHNLPRLRHHNHHQINHHLLLLYMILQLMFSIIY